LWIVAVRGTSDAISAEGLGDAPHVFAERRIVQSANATLRDTIGLVSSLNTIVLTPFPFVLGAWEERPRNQPEMLPLRANRAEPSAATIVVLPGASRDLDAYLKQRELRLGADELAGIRPYLDRDFTLVCVWASGTGDRVLGVRIMLPRGARPALPLPAASNEDGTTTMYVRGWALPTPAGASRQFIRAVIGETDVRDLLPLQLQAAPRWDSLEFDVALTRVAWHGWPTPATDEGDDLPVELIASSALAAADTIDQAGLTGLWMVTTACGGVLALVLPLLVLPREKRRAGDYFWAACLGVAGGFSILASTFVYQHWLRARGLDGPFMRPRKRPPHDDEELSGVAVVLVLTPVVVTVLACLFRDPSLLEAVAIIGMFGVPLFVLVWFIHRTWGRLSTLLAFFAVTHLAVVTLVCIALQLWLSPYD
jgi:hypothetical protein